MNPRINRPRRQRSAQAALQPHRRVDRRVESGIVSGAASRRIFRLAANFDDDPLPRDDLARPRSGRAPFFAARGAFPSAWRYGVTPADGAPSRAGVTKQ